MKKLGIGKKDKSEDGEDAKRAHLFGRSKSKSPAPPANNPYAAPPGNVDPYAKPAPMSGSHGQPPPYHNNPGGPPVADPGARSEKSGVPPGGYGGQRGYGQPQGGYGGQSGYGNSNPYGSASSSQSRGGGGYGGLGNDDPNRNELFGGAKDRYDQKKQQQQQQGLPPEEQNQLGGGSGSVSGEYGGDQGYKPYEERQLTVSCHLLVVPFLNFSRRFY